MKNFIIFGKPGAGKDTQAEIISEIKKLFHLTTGGLLRAEMKRGTLMGNEIKEILDRNEFVPDHMIQQMVMESLVTTKLLDYRGVLFNGFPRTREQAAHISAGMKTDLVIHLDISDQLSIERQLRRGAESTDPRPEDLSVNAVKQRLLDYHAKTEPILQYYGDIAVPMVEIDGSLPANQVTRIILSSIEGTWNHYLKSLKSIRYPCMLFVLCQLL